MKETLAKCSDEIGYSSKIFLESTGKASEALGEQKAQIEKLIDVFEKHAKASPWIFRKCSLQGLYMARCCLSDIREDSNYLCLEVLKELKRVGKVKEAP